MAFVSWPWTLWRHFTLCIGPLLRDAAKLGRLVLSQLRSCWQFGNWRSVQFLNCEQSLKIPLTTLNSISCSSIGQKKATGAGAGGSRVGVQYCYRQLCTEQSRIHKPSSTTRGWCNSRIQLLLQWSMAPSVHCRLHCRSRLRFDRRLSEKQRRSDGVGRTGKVRGTPSAGPRVPGKKSKIIFPLQWVKLLTDMQLFGCELHKHAFGGRAPPGPAGEL